MTCRASIWSMLENEFGSDLLKRRRNDQAAVLEWFFPNTEWTTTEEIIWIYIFNQLDLFLIYFFFKSAYTLSLTWFVTQLVTPPRPLQKSFLPFDSECFISIGQVYFSLWETWMGGCVMLKHFREEKVLPLRRIHSHATDSCCFAIILKIWRTVPAFELSSRFMLC